MFKIYGDHSLGNSFNGHQLFHTGRDAGDHRHIPVLQNAADNLHPLSRGQISMNIGLIENQISGRVQQNLPVKKTVILVQLLGFQIILRHDQFHVGEV